MGKRRYRRIRQHKITSQGRFIDPPLSVTENNKNYFEASSITEVGEIIVVGEVERSGQYMPKKLHTTFTQRDDGVIDIRRFDSKGRPVSSTTIKVDSPGDDVVALALEGMYRKHQRTKDSIFELERDEKRLLVRKLKDQGFQAKTGGLTESQLDNQIKRILKQKDKQPEFDIEVPRPDLKSKTE